MTTVLLVDDDRALRKLLRAYLEAVSISVLEAASGEDGLAAIERAAPTLVLLDVRLPGIDGFEVLRRLELAGRSRAGDPRHLGRGRARPARRLPARRDRLRRQAGLAEDARRQGQGVRVATSTRSALSDRIICGPIDDRARRAPRPCRRVRGAADPHASTTSSSRSPRTRAGSTRATTSSRRSGGSTRRMSRRGSSTSTSRTCAGSSPTRARPARSRRSAASATGWSRPRLRAKACETLLPHTRRRDAADLANLDTV